MPTVASEVDTVRAIIEGKRSIARFGDGELKLCVGRKQMNQISGQKIRRKLRSILRSNKEELLVGIPRIYGISKCNEMPKAKAEFWSRYLEDRFMDLYNEDKLYYSAFITRPDSAPQIDNRDYWLLMRMVWDGRDVVLLQGKGRDFNGDGALLSNAKSLTTIYGPRKNAYESQKRLMGLLLDKPKDSLFILSLGPAATVFAHDMCKHGRQTLDLGHLGAFYANAHPKSSGYDGSFYDIDK
jgi:glycosyltransferase family protein